MAELSGVNAGAGNIIQHKYLYRICRHKPRRTKNSIKTCAINKREKCGRKKRQRKRKGGSWSKGRGSSSKERGRGRGNCSRKMLN